MGCPLINLVNYAALHRLVVCHSKEHVYILEVFKFFTALKYAHLGSQTTKKNILSQAKDLKLLLSAAKQNYY